MVSDHGLGRGQTMGAGVDPETVIIVNIEKAFRRGFVRPSSDHFPVENWQKFSLNIWPVPSDTKLLRK